MKLEKLELKHLAAYLPYGLKILYFDNQRKMNAGNGSSTHWIGITATLQRQGENCKPILRPLSDLTKEIEVGGERFVPVDKLKMTQLEFLLTFHRITLSDANKLFEWHFDVFGLIDAGLAIDINNLKTEL